MATEQLANSAQTTLMAAVDDSGPTVSLVVASALAFPNSGTFRIRIDDELMLVTAVSGMTWTAKRPIESTAAVAHSSGAIVTQVLTAALMNELTPLVADQSANAVLAGPTSGAAAAPTFRALTAADVPTLNQSTTGNAATATALATARTISATGDLSYTSPPFDGSANVTAAATLAASGVTAGSYTNASVTVDAKGRVTAAASGSAGTVTSFSSGGLSPLFTTAVATPTSTPALSFTPSAQSANQVFAGPASGAAAAPTFRALTAADLPAIALGGAAVSGVLGYANGGTGASATPANGNLLVGNGSGYTLATLTAGTGVTVTNGAGSITIAANPPAAGYGLSGAIDGVILSTNSVSSALTTNVTVSPGTARDSTDTISMALSSAITKNLGGTWAAGNNQHGLDTGSVAATTWYHVYLIATTGGTVDVVISTSATGPTLPTGYSYYRRIGSVLTTSGSAITPFVQFLDEFYWQTPFNDVNASVTSTSANNHALTVPTGVVVSPFLAVLGAGGDSSSNPSAVLISSLALPDNAAGTNAGGFTVFAYASSYTQNGAFTRSAWTNTSAQIRWRVQSSGGTTGTTKVYITTMGWFDPRGRKVS